MKTSLFLPMITAFLLLAQLIFAQNEPLMASVSAHAQTSLVANQNAQFLNLGKYLDDTLLYPERAQKYGVEGTVTVAANIGSDGAILSVELYKGIGFGCDEALMTLVTHMPKWAPAVKNGQQVPQKVFIRACFRLQ